MIRDMDNLSLLKFGHKLDVDMISHWQLEMVQENHIHVIKVILLRIFELDIPLCCTPYKSALKKEQLNGVIFKQVQ